MTGTFVALSTNSVDKSEIPLDLKSILMGIQVESRIDFTTPDEKRPKQIVAADIVRFTAGAKLEIGLPSHRYVVLYAKKLILPGGNERTYISVPKHSSEIGAPGVEGDKGAKNFHGEKGADGKQGTTGPEGRPMPTFALITDEIEYLQTPISDRPLEIDVSGSIGGTGGTGGKGGEGGDGRDGIRGISNI